MSLSSFVTVVGSDSKYSFSDGHATVLDAEAEINRLPRVVVRCKG